MKPIKFRKGVMGKSERRPIRDLENPILYEDTETEIVEPETDSQLKSLTEFLKPKSDETT